jgi:hypothetical protein
VRAGPPIYWLPPRSDTVEPRNHIVRRSASTPAMYVNRVLALDGFPEKEIRGKKPQVSPTPRTDQGLDVPPFLLAATPCRLSASRNRDVPKSVVVPTARHCLRRRGIVGPTIAHRTGWAPSALGIKALARGRAVLWPGHPGVYRVCAVLSSESSALPAPTVASLRVSLLDFQWVQTVTT